MLGILLLTTVLLGWAVGTSMVKQLKAQPVQLQGRLVQTAQLREMAVLLNQQRLPAMLVTFDPQQSALLLQRLNKVKQEQQDSTQLWVLAVDTPPRSLGMIERKYKTLQMPVSEEALHGVTQLAISSENKDGTTAVASPALPYLDQGWLVQNSI